MSPSTVHLALIHDTTSFVRHVHISSTTDLLCSRPRGQLRGQLRGASSVCRTQVSEQIGSGRRQRFQLPALITAGVVAL